MNYAPYSTCRRCQTATIDPVGDGLYRACRMELSPPPLICHDCGGSFRTQGEFIAHQVDCQTSHPRSLT